MNKSLEDTFSTKGNKSISLILGAVGGIFFLLLITYLVITKQNTDTLWPLIAFIGGCLGFGSGESVMAKKLSLK